jgi:hypothetical protein
MFRTSTIKAANASFMETQFMGFRVRVRREINYGFENERKALKAEWSTYRTKHKNDYWDIQTQAENMWLEEYKKERFEK